VMDEAGTVLATGRLPEGVAGIGQLHELIGRFVPAGGDAEVQVGIETDRGPWVAALIAAGYVVFAVNPLMRVNGFAAADSLAGGGGGVTARRGWGWDLLARRVPRRVSGRVDRCWDVVPAGAA